MGKRGRRAVKLIGGGLFGSVEFPLYSTHALVYPGQVGVLVLGLARDKVLLAKQAAVAESVAKHVFTFVVIVFGNKRDKMGARQAGRRRLVLDVGHRMVVVESTTTYNGCGGNVTEAPHDAIRIYILITTLYMHLTHDNTTLRPAHIAAVAAGSTCKNIMCVYTLR